MVYGKSDITGFGNRSLISLEDTRHFCSLHCVHVIFPPAVATFTVNVNLNSWLLLHCVLSLAVLCTVIGPVCSYVCLLVCGSVTTITRNCELHQTGSAGEGSDHLQLIKFWPSCTPRKAVCSRAKIFGSALLQPAHSVCM